MRAGARRGQLPHARRRRHDPGHAAGLLLRQDRPDHRSGHEPPDGRRDERDRLRRRGARQPRVQLRPGHAAGLPAPAATSRCSAPTRSTGRPARPTFPPYVIKRVRTPHGKDVMVGILGLVTPGVAIWDTATTSRARCGSPASSSRPRSFVPRAQARRRRRRHRLVPLRVQDLLVVRRRAALPRERQHPAGPAGPGHRRHPRRARPRGDPRAASSPTSRPASRCCCPSRSSGACG